MIILFKARLLRLNQIVPDRADLQSAYTGARLQRVPTYLNEPIEAFATRLKTLISQNTSVANTTFCLYNLN